jgi:hypothetical protein
MADRSGTQPSRPQHWQTVRRGVARGQREGRGRATEESPRLSALAPAGTVRWVEVLDALDVAPGLAAAIVEARVGFRPVGSDVKPLLGLVDGLVIATVSARPA